MQLAGYIKLQYNSQTYSTLYPCYHDMHAYWDISAP